MWWFIRTVVEVRAWMCNFSHTRQWMRLFGHAIKPLMTLLKESPPIVMMPKWSWPSFGVPEKYNPNDWQYISISLQFTISYKTMMLISITLLRWQDSHRGAYEKTSLRIILWGLVTHICVSNVNIIGSDNGLTLSRRQAIVWTNDGILLIGPVGTNFNEIWVHTF